jgi:hypothetical protein
MNPNKHLQNENPASPTSFRNHMLFAVYIYTGLVICCPNVGRGTLRVLVPPAPIPYPFLPSKTRDEHFQNA